MKKSIIYIFLLFFIFANGQKKVFKNQGEQEDYWAEELFEKEYIEQSFEKFQGKISIINKSTIKFDNKTLQVSNIKPELLLIFNEGIFYPQILIGNEKNNAIKTKAEQDSLTDKERVAYFFSRNDSLIISNFEELQFLSKSPKIKRFRFWNYSFYFANPQVYFIELTNTKATDETDLETFIKGSKLTFVKKGWIII